MGREDITQRLFREIARVGYRRLGVGRQLAGGGREGGSSRRKWFEGFRGRPGAFIYQALGVKLWSGQEEIARALVHNRRVAVRSGHGVGKTHLAADIALWFLYCFYPAVVVTTAPTKRQVEEHLWREIRRRHAGAKKPLGGRPLLAKLELDAGAYALGISADRGVNFQGFHGENLLIIMDEASGIREDIWQAAEGIAVGENNRILAIGNPLTTNGRFYQLFRPGSGWKGLRINAMEHPNVNGKGKSIPGAVSAGFVDEKVWEWCEEVRLDGCGGGWVSGSGEDPQISQLSQIGKARFLPTTCRNDEPGVCDDVKSVSLQHDVEGGSRSGMGANARAKRKRIGAAGADDCKLTIDNCQLSIEDGDAIGSGRTRKSGSGESSTSTSTRTRTIQAGEFWWRGRVWRANDLFRIRVLGEFAEADDRALIPLAWVEAAVGRELEAEGHCRAAVDVGHFRGDETVFGVRNGPKVTWIEVIGGDTVEVTGRIVQLVYEHHPEVTAIDAIGLGAGVCDALMSMPIEGIEEVKVSRKPYNPDLFENKRAELYWGLRERFQKGDIDIPQDEKLVGELSALRYSINAKGLIQIENKEKVKGRIGRSPDRADMLALLFDGAGEALIRWAAGMRQNDVYPHAKSQRRDEWRYVSEPSEAAKLREEMRGW